MALRKRTVSVPLDGGVDTHTNTEILSPPGFSRLENCEFTKAGVVTKMNGEEQVDDSGGAIPIQSSIAGLGTAGDVDLLMSVRATQGGGDVSGLYRFDEDNSAWRQTYAGGVFPVAASFDRVARADRAITHYGQARVTSGSTDYACFVWVDGNQDTADKDVKVRIETLGGASVLNTTNLGGRGRDFVTVVAAGDRFVLFGWNGTTFSYVVLDPGAPGTPSSASWAAVPSFSGTPNFVAVSSYTADVDSLIALAWSDGSTTGATVVPYTVSGTTITAGGTNVAITAAEVGGNPEVRDLWYDRVGQVLWLVATDSTGGSTWLARTTGGGSIATFQAPVNIGWPGQGSAHIGYGRTSGELLLATVDEPWQWNSDAPHPSRSLTTSVLLIDAATAANGGFLAFINGCVPAARHFAHARYGPIFPLLTPTQVPSDVNPPINATMFFGYVHDEVINGTFRRVAALATSAVEQLDTRIPGMQPPEVVSLGATAIPDGATTDETLFSVPARLTDAHTSIQSSETRFYRTTESSFDFLEAIGGIISGFRTVAVGIFTGDFGDVGKGRITGGRGRSQRNIFANYTGVQQPKQQSLVTTKLDLEPADLQVFAEAGTAGTVVTGGVLSTYNEGLVNEAAFLTAPVINDITGNGVVEFGGDWNTEDNIVVAVVFKFTDPAANIHRSPMTLRVLKGQAPSSLKSYDTLDVEVVLPPSLSHLSVSVGGASETNAVQIETYVSGRFNQEPFLRDVSVAETGGTASLQTITLTGFYDGGISVGPAGHPAEYILSFPTITSPITPYAWGSDLNVDIPPPASQVITDRGRVWLISRDDPRIIWASKLITPGLGLEFSALLTITANDDADGFTALGTLDDKTILFTKNDVYWIAGDGPDNGGRGAPLGNPTRLANGHGCLNPNSLVSTPVGLFYRGAGGIMLLDRGTQTQYIGLPVEDYTPASASVERAIHYAGKRQVHFLVHDGDEERILVYDYSVGKWTVKVRQNTTDITMFRRVPYRALGTNVYKDTTGYDDPAAQNGILMESGWFKLNSLEGFGRIYRIYLTGNFSTNSIRVSVGYNYNGFNLSDDRTEWSEADITVSEDTIVIRPAHRKCKSFRLLIEETVESGGYDGAGFVLSGMTIEYGVFPQGYRHYRRSLQK